MGHEKSARPFLTLVLAPCLSCAPSSHAATTALEEPPPIVIPAPVDSAPEHATMPFPASADMLAGPGTHGPGGTLLIKRLSFIRARDLPTPLREMLGQRLRSADTARVEIDEDEGAWPVDASALVPTWSSQGIREIQPRDLAGTGLAALRFVGWAPDAAGAGETVTTAERHFLRDDGVVVVLQEWNYGHGSAAIFMVRELLNAKVGEHPAVLSIETTPSGRVRSSLRWQDLLTDYRITVLDDLDHPRAPRGGAYGRAWLLELARSLGT